MERPERYWKGDHFVVGGSDFPSILGVAADYAPGRMDLYEIMRGERVEKRDIEGEYRLRRGTAMEEPLAWWYSQKTGYKVDKAPEQDMTEWPWLRISADRVAWTPEGEKRGVEIKKRGAAAKGWGEDGTDQIPEDVYPQIQIYAHCLGVEWMDVVAEVGERKGIWHVRYDPIYVLDHALPAGEEFVRCVTEGIPPEPMQVRDFRGAYTRNDELLTADESLVIDYNDMAAMKGELAALQARIEARRFRLQKALEDNEASVLLDPSGGTLVSYRANKNGKRSFRPSC